MKRVPSVKYLRVIIDENPSFSKYIQYISSNIPRNVGILRKLKYFFPFNILGVIYFLLSILIWYFVFRCGHLLLEQIWSHYVLSKIRRFGFLLIVIIVCELEIVIQQFILYQFQVFLISILPYLCLIYCIKMQLNFWLVCLRDEPEYETRNLSAIRKPKKRSTRSAFSICHVLPSIWESLPFDIVQETDRPTFCGLLRDHCFGIYDLWFFFSYIYK